MNRDIPQELPARRGFTVSYLGKTLLSRIDPVAQGERLATDIIPKERTLYLCPSPLYGYGLSIILEKLQSSLTSKKSAILCIEADEQLFEISQKALSAFDTNNDGFPSMAIKKVSCAAEACIFVRETWGKRVFRRLEVIRLSGGWQLFPKLYDEIETTLRREFALEWGNAMTLIRLGRLYTRNLIRNLSLLPLCENITALKFGSAPVLVMGAGPSLDSMLDKLQTLGAETGRDKRRFRIICVDTCLPALHERLILPDLVVILESQHWNLKDFSGARGRKIGAAMDLSALPSSTRVLEGKRFFFATPWTHMALFRRLEEAALLPEMYPPLGSVGLSAVALALNISAGPVLISGIDFSYTIDAFHTRSTQGQTDRLLKLNRLRSIFDTTAVFKEGSFSTVSNNGKPVRSNPALRRYRDLFKQEFGAENRLMDISGSGLNLGLKTVSPEEAIRILTEAGQSAPYEPGASFPFKNEKIKAFISGEEETLKQLRDMLTGDTAPEPARLEELLDAADYLWAHFPDCAGAAGRRPPVTDLGFLKRVRAEIDSFLSLWEISRASMPG